MGSYIHEHMYKNAEGSASFVPRFYFTTSEVKKYTIDSISLRETQNGGYKWWLSDRKKRRRKNPIGFRS